MDGVVVGRAHGDDRGEFLLLLGPGAATGPDLAFPIQATVTVFGPDPPPPPGPDAALDPLWDLPLEGVPPVGAGGRRWRGRFTPRATGPPPSPAWWASGPTACAASLSSLPERPPRRDSQRSTRCPSTWPQGCTSKR